jgi:hypothetical protein
MYKVGFLHVTKTGGVDFKNHAPPEVYTKNGHNETAEQYAKDNLPCFGIMRHPIERFVSAYCFSKLGSEKYRMGMQYSDINSFIQNHFKRGECHMILFKPQMDWFRNGDPANTYILKYNDNNDDLLKAFLKNVFDIDMVYSVTSKANVSVKEECNITEYNVKYLEEYYAEDIAIFKKLDTYKTLEDIKNSSN